MIDNEEKLKSINDSPISITTPIISSARYSTILPTYNPKNNSSLFQYTCINCNQLPEIININFLIHSITLQCPIHNIYDISITDYLQAMKKKFKCNLCQSIDSLEYCYNCDLIFCFNCISNKKLHNQNHFTVNMIDFPIKCNSHFNEYYSNFCTDCKKNLCNKCLSENKNHINHNLLNYDVKIKNLLSPDDLNKINRDVAEYENILSVEKYSDLLTLNFLLINSYMKYKQNYLYTYNLKIYSNILSDTNNLNILRFKNLEQQKKCLNDFNRKCGTNYNKNESNIKLLGKHIDNEIYNLLCGAKFEQLKELSLFYNQISHIHLISKQLNKFCNLRKFSMSYNQTNDIILLDKLDFSTLKELNLSHNEIENIDFIKKIKLDELEELNLSHNNIKDISNLEKISKIKKINLSFNHINDLSIFQNFEKLININVSNNEIGDNSHIDKIKFKNDMELDFSYNKIRNIKIFEKIGKIENLNLSFNQINYEIAKNKDILINLNKMVDILIV